MISLEILKILTPLQKLPKNRGDWGKLIVAKGFKSCPKSNKSPNLVTLATTAFHPSSAADHGSIPKHTINLFDSTIWNWLL